MSIIALSLNFFHQGTHQLIIGGGLWNLDRAGIFFLKFINNPVQRKRKSDFGGRKYLLSEISNPLPPQGLTGVSQSQLKSFGCRIGSSGLSDNALNPSNINADADSQFRNCFLFVTIHLLNS